MSQRPHETLPSAAFSLGYRTEILLHSGHGLPCRRVSEAVLLLTPARAAVAPVRAPNPLHRDSRCASAMCPAVPCCALTPACSAIIDRFLGRVVYKREHSGHTDWLLRRLRRWLLFFFDCAISVVICCGPALMPASPTRGPTLRIAWQMLVPALRLTVCDAATVLRVDVWSQLMFDPR